MNPVEPFNLDLRALATFLVVLDEGSVSRAAITLGVSQSAVSHTLERLRQALGDPLFVKSGRGITPTRYAQQAGPHIRQVLDDLRALSSGPPFSPQTANMVFTIAANDYERDLLLPDLLAILREQAPGVRLQVIAAGIPSAELLRQETCDLIVSPHPPEASDIMQRGLMTDRMVVFYDPAWRQPPHTLADFLKADHISLMLGAAEQPGLDQALNARNLRRTKRVSVSNFSALASLLYGTDMLAVAPERMGQQLLSRAAWVPLPFDYKPFTLLMIWHQRYQNDAAHRWLRNRINAVAATMNGMVQ